MADQTDGLTIPTARPNLSLTAAAVVFAVFAGYAGGWQWAPITAFAVIVAAGVWRILALLGYIAGALDREDDIAGASDQGDDDA
jgi:hypothetical protein